MSSMLLPLKVSIVTSGKTQRSIAVETRIPESRLSAIVRGWENPTDDEMTALPRALGQSSDLLFGLAVVELKACR